LTVEDNEIRSRAEQKLYQIMRRNYTDFFFTIASIVGDDKKDILLRSSAASIFKRLIACKVLLSPHRKVINFTGISSIIKQNKA
jgi:hypothetical protein